MIFQHTWQAVIEGRKTQTRRLIRPGEWFWHDFASIEGGRHCVLRDMSEDPQILYAAQTKTYAVQPGRGKPTIIYNPDHPCYGIDIIEPGDNHYKYAKEGTWGYRGQGYLEARIRITGIRKEDVRNISAEDVIAEGFQHPSDFFITWAGMHDKQAVAALTFFKDCPPPDSFVYAGITYTSPGSRVVAQRDGKEVYFYSPKDYLAQRPTERYQAWALTFEVVP